MNINRFNTAAQNAQSIQNQQSQHTTASELVMETCTRIASKHFSDLADRKGRSGDANRQLLAAAAGRIVKLVSMNPAIAETPQLSWAMETIEERDRKGRGLDQGQHAAVTGLIDLARDTTTT